VTWTETGIQWVSGLHWHTIQLDQPGRIPDDEITRALDIKVERAHRNEAKLAPEEIYSGEATTWPLHLHMRAVPLLRDIFEQ